jgi:hypothetical protein
MSGNDGVTTTALASGENYEQPIEASLACSENLS